jgi:hypothetical protein
VYRVPDAVICTYECGQSSEGVELRYSWHEALPGLLFTKAAGLLQCTCSETFNTCDHLSVPLMLKHNPLAAFPVCFLGMLLFADASCMFFMSRSL